VAVRGGVEGKFSLAQGERLHGFHSNFVGNNNKTKIQAFFPEYFSEDSLVMSGYPGKKYSPGLLIFQ
jgi:hypothetical protein